MASFRRAGRPSRASPQSTPTVGRPVDMGAIDFPARSNVADKPVSSDVRAR
jgi:hypothetical protein